MIKFVTLFTNQLNPSPTLYEGRKARVVKISRAAEKYKKFNHLMKVVFCAEHDVFLSRLPFPPLFKLIHTRS